jgi:hypothetical protein
MISSKSCVGEKATTFLPLSMDVWKSAQHSTSLFNQADAQKQVILADADEVYWTFGMGSH